MNLDLEQLIERSGALHSAIARTLAEVRIPNHPRAILAATHADIALEHGGSILLLLSTGHLNSTLALLRIQLDGVVKSLWTLYAATDAKIMAVYDSVHAGSLKEPNNMPAIKEMIDALPEDKAPGLAPSLRLLVDALWKPLSSFVHGGVFALHERHRELPAAWYTDTLRNANGLSISAAMAIAASTGNAQDSMRVKTLQLEYSDCLTPFQKR